YLGFGDVLVFILYGLVSTAGSYYSYGHHWVLTVRFPAVAVALFCTAVLNMNNMRDIQNDATMGNNTLAVKMGFNKAQQYHFQLILFSIIFINIFTINTFTTWYQFLYVFAFIPLFKNIGIVSKANNPRLLDPELKRLSLTTFLISLLIAIALILNIFINENNLSWPCFFNDWN